MELLSALPAYIKIGASFSGILLVYRFGLSLGWSILLFAAVLTLWTGTGISGAEHQLKSLSRAENYSLLIVILLLLFFTESLTITGRMKRTIDALEHWLNNKKLLLVGFPALVGLLPMPGGALFSAPLVDAVDREKDLDAEHKVAINYWFRHIWEYWWPLYPGIILAIKYSTLPSLTFYLIQIPFTIASFFGGYFFIVRKIRNRRTGGKRGKLDHRAVMASIFPISILVAVSLACSFILPYAGISKTLSNLLGMIAGLILGLCVIYAGKMHLARKALPFFTKKNTRDMMLLVLGILIFSSALTIPITASSTLVTLMRDEFLTLGIPILLVIALIPFISGAVTGVAFGFVGASFPIVFAMLPDNPSTGVLMAATTFAYGCGYAGMILSPVHICFVVTNEYFKTKLFSSYRYILLPLAVVLLAGCFMSALYYNIVG